MYLSVHNKKNKSMRLFLSVLFVSILMVFSKNHIFAFFKISETKGNITISHISLSPYDKGNGTVSIIKIKKNFLDYKVVDKSHKKYDFYVNANYFDKTPVGEVIINRKKISHKGKKGGFFTSNGGNPTFYFRSHPKVEYSSQTHTVGIIRGELNSKIFNYKWARYRLPRLIVGEDKSGNIIIVHSNINGGCSISTISKIAKSQGVYNGLIFDGGASIEIGINADGINYHYQQVPDIMRSLGNVPTPWVFIVGSKN